MSTSEPPQEAKPTSVDQSQPQPEPQPQTQPQPQASPDTANSQAPPPPNGESQPKPEAAASPAAAPAAGPKLTNAELKAKAKAEKQARRAQAKAASGAAPGGALTSTPAGQPGQPSGESKGNKTRGKADGAPSSGSGATGKGAAGAKNVAPVTPPKPEKPGNKIPECFSHLTMARRLSITQADKDVHPTVLTLGQQMATFAIDESITRLRVTLLAFKKVIDSYTTPPGNTLARHLTPHVLNPQIEYLSACRPMCFSMGNAIRWLKLQVSKIDPDVPEIEAKKELCASIDAFIQERITIADDVITENMDEFIQDGEVILVYGRNALVERTLLRAHKLSKKQIEVIVVDDPYEQKGQDLAKILVEEGFTVSYSGDFGALPAQVQRADRVILGAESMFSNGALYARCGTSDIAMAAKDYGTKVFALCETINITERVSSDSLTYNEIDPERCTAAKFRLLYDTTPSEHLTTVVTEINSAQPTSVSYLLRKLEDSN
ncbi:hypothetical protein F4808DRAFT_215257 [Astrocystis sublimbata]|nr:hypothetical protein F4808DRAFT_215257 [Astrocystis sublimbata]